MPPGPLLSDVDGEIRYVYSSLLYTCKPALTLAHIMALSIEIFSLLNVHKFLMLWNLPHIYTGININNAP